MRMMRHDVVATDVWRAVRTVKLSERSRATNSDASQVAYDAQRSVVFGFEMGAKLPRWWGCCEGSASTPLPL